MDEVFRELESMKPEQNGEEDENAKEFDKNTDKDKLIEDPKIKVKEEIREIFAAANKVPKRPPRPPKFKEEVKRKPAQVCPFSQIQLC